MADESKSKSQPLPGQYEDSIIPEYLAESGHAIGDAVAAGGFQHVPVPLDSGSEPKNSPEDLAKLVDRLQKTFGAENSASASNGRSGQIAPPPSPFVANYNAEAQEKSRRRSQYHTYMEEVQDKHWTQKP